MVSRFIGSLSERWGRPRFPSSLGHRSNSGCGNGRRVCGQCLGNGLCNATSREGRPVSEPHHRPEAVRGRKSHKVQTGYGRFKTRREYWRAVNRSDLGTNFPAQEFQAVKIYSVTGGRDHVIRTNLAVTSVDATELQQDLSALDFRALDGVPKDERHTTNNFFLREPTPCWTQVRS